MNIRRRIDRRTRNRVRRLAGRRGIRRSGFTLVEVMVVVVIIGVLAALVAPRVFQNIGKSKINATKARASVLKTALNSFRIDCRELKSSDSLDILMEGPSDVAEGSWNGPYLNSEESLRDAWGFEFILEVPGTKNVDFDIVSYGSDGEPGGEGDAADIRE